MNPHAHQAIVNKLGYDPMVKKPTPVSWRLINTRTNQIIITGKYSLCSWKKKLEQATNPLSKFKIEPL